jgi:TonB family protein
MLHRSRVILFSILAVSLISVAAVAQKDDGARSTAVQFLQQEAERGDAGAQLNLAFAYKDGRGIKQNSAEAAKWFRKSAEQGNPRAQFELGKLYEQGTGVTQDYAEAMRWYRKAAEQVLTKAQADTESGRGGGTGAGPARVSAGIVPYVAGNGVVPPNVLDRPLPPYTEEARRARISGIVLLQCVVRKDGTVDSFKVVRGLGYGLEESAISTVATRWRFEPGTKDGVPVDVQANIEVMFRLPGDENLNTR